MTDENYEARAQAHLASIKRDMKASMEDAVVRAMHKVMAEFEAKSDERLMEDWGPGPHEVHSLPARGPEQPAQPRAWFTVDELNAWAEKKLKENPQWTDQPAQRCPLCNYQHGHAIGCKNNPVDIALNKMAENARELGLDYEQPAQKPVALPEKIYEFVPTPEPAKWHHPECEGECIACLIERVVQEAYGSQGLSYLQRHLTSSPAQQEPLTGGDERRHIICLCPDCIKTPQRKPLTHEQRVDLLAKFEAHKHEWHAPAILIDMVEAAHGIGEKK